MNEEQVKQSFVKFLLTDKERLVTDDPQKALVISFLKLFLYVQPQNGHHLMNTTDRDNVAPSLSIFSLQG